MRYPRSLVLLGSLAALVCAPAAPAFSAAAKLSGQAMPAGFARISLAFDETVPLKLRVANGVLSVAFATAVDVDVAAVSKQLPDWISLARVDPDRRGMRFALTRPFKANLIEAGDKAFIDILPENWRGLMPGPPPEVVAELAERLRRAEAKARDVAARPPEPPRLLSMRVARLPTLDRLTAILPPGVASEERFDEGKLTLRFDRQFALDQPQLRRSLPEGIALVSAETSPGGTSIVLSAPADRTLRSFRDEDALVVDLVRPLKAETAMLDHPVPVEPAPARTPGKPEIPGPAEPAAATAQGPRPPDPAPPAEQTVPASQPMSVAVTSGERSARVDFRFPRPTGAAAFTDAGMLTLVFDTRETLDPAWLAPIPRKLVEDTTLAREGRIVTIRMKLAGPQLVRLAGEGPNWTLLFGEQGGKAAEAVTPRRAVDERGQTIVAAGLPGMTGVHWLERGPGGLPVAVATAMPPARSVIKPFRFVDFTLLQTAQGLAVSPRADDVVVRAGEDRALIGRATGLTLSLDPDGDRAEPTDAPARAPLVDTATWNELRSGPLRERERALKRDIMDASRARKAVARLALARFYVANNLMPEAAGPLKTLLADDQLMREAREPLFLTGAIAAGLHRDSEALRAFEAAPIKEEAEVGLWRALVEQRLGRNAQALTGFRRGTAILDRYPQHLQAQMRIAKARAALAMQDLTIAGQEIQTLTELPPDLVDGEELALLQAMLDDASGRPEAALAGYRHLFESPRRPVAAEAQLRAVRLSQTEKRSDLPVDEAIARLETVSIIWRGGNSEIEALSELGRLYAERKRWRDAFMAARRANENFPDNPLTRALHDETAQRFVDLFGSADDQGLSRIDALALFYDFKEFLPIGRRGDEITRLLADRLVELDLLDSAAEILRYQMDRRLQGAARSTAAARLAMVSLMAGKPTDALQALTTTRLVELPAEVRRARLLLEAKALSDLSRTDQALEMLEGEKGNEINRLRADIYWTGRRWREAGEEHERILGESWRAPAPLTEPQRNDVMRAAIAYVMADEALSLDRLRTKFAARMADGPDARTFAFVTTANRSRTGDMREIARVAAGATNVTDFLDAYRERYPALSTAVRPAPAPSPEPAGERRAAGPGGAGPG